LKKKQKTKKENYNKDETEKPKELLELAAKNKPDFLYKKRFIKINPKYLPEL